MRVALGITLMALLAGCLQPQAPAAAEDDGLTTLDIQVVDALTGAAVPKALVEVQVPSVGSVRKTTDSEGQVSVTLRPAPKCVLVVERLQYHSGSTTIDCLADRALRVPLRPEQVPSTPAASSSSSSQTAGPAPSNSTSNGTGSPPANQTDPTANQTQNQTDPGQSRPFEPEEPSGTCGSLGSFEPVAPNAALADGLATGWPLLELDLALLADPAFVQAHPQDWRQLLQALVADASLQYERQLGFRLNLSIVDRLPDGSLAPGTGDGQQRAVGRGFMHANHPGADVDAVAVMLGDDYEGTTAGQVECVHGAAYPDYAYLWAEYDQDRDDGEILAGVGIFKDIPLKIFMHELGHLLAAHHHYSTCGHAPDPGDANGACDVMINAVDFAGLEFGPTNRLVMRSFVEQIGIGEPV